MSYSRSDTHRTTKWIGRRKARCKVEGCKKRAKYEMTNGEYWCKKHARGDKK